MTPRQHIRLLVYSFITWLSFYLVGLPEYFQHWPFWAKFAALPAVTALYFPMTRWSLTRLWDNQAHFKNSLWLALYLTLPLFVYDYLLLALYKDFGIGFVIPYWYLTFFYFSFWIQIPWIGWRMERDKTYLD